MSLISLVKLSELQRFKRLDAEYYQPDYLDNYDKLKKVGAVRLGDKEYSQITDGIHASIDFDSQSGIRCLSAQSVKKGYFDLTANTFISSKQHNKNLKTSLKIGDVIVSSVGTIGNCAVVTENMLPSNADRHVGIIRTTNQIDPYYLCAFLNSKFGQFQTAREATGNVQQNLFIDKMTEILVPLLPKQDVIAKITQQATDKLNQSEQIMFNTKNRLLSLLNYSMDTPEELTYISNLEAVKSAHRFDSEYYHPKYARVLSLIKSNSKQVEKIDDLFRFRRGIEVGSETYLKQGIPFVRVSNIKELEIDYDKLQYVSQSIYDLFKEKYSPRSGELLLTKDATAGIAYVFKDNDPVLISSGMLRGIPKTDENLEYIALVINTPFVRLQIERAVTGSIIVHWQPDQIKDTRIPLVKRSEQDRLGEYVVDAKKLRKEAKEFFKEAVHLIETGIEQLTLK